MINSSNKTKDEYKEYELVEEAQRGSDKAFEELINIYKEYLYLYYPQDGGGADVEAPKSPVGHTQYRWRKNVPNTAEEGNFTKGPGGQSAKQGHGHLRLHFISA